MSWTIWILTKGPCREASYEWGEPTMTIDSGWAGRRTGKTAVHLTAALRRANGGSAWWSESPAPGDVGVSRLTSFPIDIERPVWNHEGDERN